MIAQPAFWCAVCLALWALLAAGCAKEPSPPPAGPAAKRPATQRPYTVLGRTYRPLDTATGFSQRGLASWYGPGFQGKRTSNGEVYDMQQMTAAHKTLPMDTWVEVTNLANGKKAVVRVNDRGPFVDGRVIDLSRAAAAKLGVIAPGTAEVEVVALGYKKPGRPASDQPQNYTPASYQAGPFTVQVGAFANESNAWRLAARLRPRFGRVSVVPYDRGDQVFHRVRVGKTAELDQAEKLQSELRRAGFGQAFAVAW
jgi:rare lipoprotein A